MTEEDIPPLTLERHVVDGRRRVEDGTRGSPSATLLRLVSDCSGLDARRRLSQGLSGERVGAV